MVNGLSLHVIPRAHITSTSLQASWQAVPQGRHGRDIPYM